MTVKRLVIIGGGGFGRGTVDIIKAVNSSSTDSVWDLVGIYDDAPSEANLRLVENLGVQFLGAVPDHSPEVPTHYVVGINSPGVRQTISQRLDALGWLATNIIHPDATIETSLEIGPGAVIRAGVRVATNTSVGPHVHLNFNVVLGHDVELHEFVSINPLASIAGEVSVGERSIIGTGATILQGRSVGPDTIVGASACVTRTWHGGETLIGLPAYPALEASQSDR